MEILEGLHCECLKCRREAQMKTVFRFLKLLPTSSSFATLLYVSMHLKRYRKYRDSDAIKLNLTKETDLENELEKF